MVRQSSTIPATGVLNPYALVSSRKGKFINWTKMSRDERRKTLVDELKLPFYKLFDSKNNSPLFYYPGSTENTSSQTVETGDLVPRCSAAVKSWNAKPDGSFSCPLPLSSPPPDINDANQGCSLDCWFIAALASVAWTWPDYIYKYTKLETPCRLKLFRPDPCSPTPPYFPAAGTDYGFKPEYFTPSSSLPWGSAGIGNWVFDRPSSSHPTVLWSALFEKCYADFYQLSGYTVDQPNIAKFGTGNPLNSLSHLTGIRYNTKLDVTNHPEYSQSAFDMTEFATADYVFDTIYQQCNQVISGGSGSQPVAVPAMTNFPMVAWTYPSETLANRTNNVDPVKNPEKSAKYTSDSIVAQHSYSVLGVHYADGKKYIVLRNPWGMVIPNAYGGDPEFTDPNSDPADDIYYKEMNASLKTGIWTVTPKPDNHNLCLGGTPKPVSIDLGLDDGIFALAVDKFRWHFKGFGWVWP